MNDVYYGYGICFDNEYVDSSVEINVDFEKVNLIDRKLNEALDQFDKVCEVYKEKEVTYSFVNSYEKEHYESIGEMYEGCEYDGCLDAIWVGISEKHDVNFNIYFNNLTMNLITFRIDEKGVLICNEKPVSDYSNEDNFIEIINQIIYLLDSFSDD